MTASGVEHAVSALHKMLSLTVIGVEELVIFIIKVLFQTYLCLITLAVRGSVDVAVGVIKDAGDFLNSTVKELGQDINKVVDTFEDGLNDFLDGLNTAASLFGGSVPQLKLDGQIEELENLHLPSSIDKSLDKLNDSMPTFDQVNNFTQNVLRIPFKEIKKLMNESLGPYQFDRSVLPIPAKKQLTFCADNNGIDKFFKGITDLASTAQKIFIAVILIAATLVCIPVAWREIRRWRTMKERSQLVRKEAHDPMDVVYIVSRPYSAAAGIKSASRFSNSRRQILVRWAIAYATSLPALFVLCLGIAGLFACLCQFLLLRSVQKAVPELTTQVSAFADKVVHSLENASVEWATDANSAIGDMNTDLNHNVFGWVNTSTTALNDTLNTFVDKTTDILNYTFGGTPLYNPLMDVFDCLIGLKVEGIQNGLTWVHNHAHIDFPLLPNDTFSRGAEESISKDSSAGASDSFLADAGDSTSDKITEVVARVVRKIEEGIKTEALISTVVVMVWVLIALIGILRALMLFWGRDKNRGDGGGVPIQPVSMNQGAGVGSGFVDVPLAAMPNRSAARSQPALVPGYEYDNFASSSTPKTTSEEEENEKLGFAGYRQYGSPRGYNAGYGNEKRRP